MEERGNKTIMCSVLFLDIVEYSRKPVAGQISLKDRFNNYLSLAIRDVPITDRIILDTGDGAAINFLGDVEDALKAALSLRESLLSEDDSLDPPLMVRMGINLGPVRLVRDINGQPNIVGDGINVAQRVMGFADVAQILVSRSYYDAVSRLSPQYAGMFHYQGSRTDKHVREHEVYAIGYPGDKTTQRSYIRPKGIKGQASNLIEEINSKLQGGWQTIVSRYQKAEPRQRAVYIGMATLPVLLLFVLLAIVMRQEKVAPVTEIAQLQTGNAETAAPQPAVLPKTTERVVSKPSPPTAESPKLTQTEKPKSASTSKPKEKSKAKSRATKPSSTETKTSQFAHEEKPNKHAANEAVNEKQSAVKTGKTQIAVHCINGTEVFVDGVRKGSVESGSFLTDVTPGAHTVIASHSSGGIYSQNVNVDSGVTVLVRPNFCK